MIATGVLHPKKEPVNTHYDSELVILCKVGEVHIFKHRLYISALEQARVLILCSSRSHKHNL